MRRDKFLEVDYDHFTFTKSVAPTWLQTPVTATETTTAVKILPFDKDSKKFPHQDESEDLDVDLLRVEPWDVGGGAALGGGGGADGAADVQAGEVAGGVRGREGDWRTVLLPLLHSGRCCCCCCCCCCCFRAWCGCGGRSSVFVVAPPSHLRSFFPRFPRGGIRRVFLLGRARRLLAL